MSFFKFLQQENKKKSASVAKERLSIILARESVGGSSPDFIPQLQRELMEVISRYTQIDLNDIRVNVDRQDNLEVLEVKIELPDKPTLPPKR